MVTGAIDAIFVVWIKIGVLVLNSYCI